MGKVSNEASKLMKAEKVNEAISLLVEEIKNKPYDSEIVTQLGYCYILISQYEKAINQLNKAISLNNKDFRAFYYLGYICQKQNELDDAIYFYKLAYSLNPNYEEVKKRLISLGQFNDSSTKLSKQQKLINLSMESDQPHINSFRKKSKNFLVTFFSFIFSKLSDLTINLSRFIFSFLNFAFKIINEAVVERIAYFIRFITSFITGIFLLVLIAIIVWIIFVFLNTIFRWVN